MIVLTILILALASINAGSIIGRRIPQSRIIGGKEVPIESYPYQVAILEDGYLRCGGSIIGNDIILTAAHCIYQFDIETIQVRVGSSYHEKDGEVMDVKWMSAHEFYDEVTSNYDIGIIILKKKLIYGPTIQPIQIVATEPEIKKDAIVSGWGKTRENGDASMILKAAHIRIVSTEDCQSYYGKPQITDQMICAGIPEGGQGSCTGDSGGPLVVDNKVVGIVSWAVGCSRIQIPTVFANVANLHSWVEEKIEISKKML